MEYHLTTETLEVPEERHDMNFDINYGSYATRMVPVEKQFYKLKINNKTYRANATTIGREYIELIIGLEEAREKLIKAKAEGKEKKRERLAWEVLGRKYLIDEIHEAATK